MADAPQRSPIPGVGPFFIVRRWRVILCKLLGGCRGRLQPWPPSGPGLKSETQTFGGDSVPCVLFGRVETLEPS
jgi:hypothetical protein